MNAVTRRRIAHLLLALVGVLIVAYPFTLGANPTPTCRGVQLQPGQTCSKADGSAEQTYEERLATAKNATPVIVGVGLLMAGFGTALFIGDVRRGREQISAR
ncbi:hypothetical protein MLP_42140 [Microlunatus phosphovorus NM-1]|uniref:Uncharacterized protein n=1 Tax=Microlunatus phosphovorus (strain ATCC 700054 / DSM 10555 / JCM 9379 / NBRC 101784 / NCIMB 13414 / VKM Ac-1990 / NM-1) TaxID=1032480 RepID=F5XS15_MICPN|nr:hypothetical protein [Microlunatus phosphovorus]BAK37228.1 hypothetical protein MLP_42140 [Microlunatus phosphovorus NM-1]